MTDPALAPPSTKRGKAMTDTKRNDWREAVIDALVVSFIYRAAHDTDPRLALGELICYEQKMALDPNVSKEARDLIERGRRDGLEEAARICEEHARTYGAINEQLTTEQRYRDYAAERALLSASSAIRHRRRPFP